MRWRLVAVLVGITIMVLVVHDVPLAAHLREVERDRIVTALQRDAFTMAGRVQTALDGGTAVANASLQDLIDRYRAADGARVTVTDRAGRAVLISDDESAAGADYSTRPEIAAAMAGTAVTGTRTSKTLGIDLLYVAVPVRSGDQILGTVRLTYPTTVVDQRVASRMRGLLVVAVISILTALVAAIVVSATLSRPLRRVRAATERLAAGDLDARAPVDEGPPEIRSLAASFNAMSERLTGLLASQRDFAGDASHQLRTPLTALRLRLDQAADLMDTDPGAARERLDAASVETERLQHLIDQLLMLARTEGRVTVNLVTVDLVAAANERAEVWGSLAEEQGVRVTCDAPGPVWVLALPQAVEQVIDNYVDNALAVAPAGTAVEIVVRRGADRHAIVSVSDRGPGLTEQQRAHAFDRFWRGGRAAGATGSGLGLAIVAQLVRASGGEARLDARDGGGLVASARLVTALTQAATPAVARAVAPAGRRDQISLVTGSSSL